MTADGDPHRLLAHVRHLTRRVRTAQRVTWLPLLVLAAVTFGAIPAHRYGWQMSGCATTASGEVCQARNLALIFYWQVALAASYVAIAYGYLRAARARGVAARVMPYVLLGIALNVLVQAVALLVAHQGWGVADGPEGPDGAAQFLLRLMDWGAAIGVALLVLAWLERHLALLLFTVGYLAVVLLRIDLGWGTHWGGDWAFLPPLVVQGGVLLLGGLGFAYVQRPRRHR